MATITASDLKLRTLQRADMENSDFVSTSELLYFINNSYAELYDILVSKFEDYYVKSPAFSFTLSGSTYSQALPSDFYKVRGVDVSLDGLSRWAVLHPYQFAQRNDNNSRVRSLVGNVKYRIYGNEILISPSTQASGTYRVWYVPKYTPLVLDGDTVDGVNGWEEYIIVDAAIKCLQKEESSVTALVAQKVALLARITTMAANRDVGSPERVTDSSSAGWHDDIFDRGW